MLGQGSDEAPGFSGMVIARALLALGVLVTLRDCWGNLGCGVVCVFEGILPGVKSTVGRETEWFCEGMFKLATALCTLM